VAAVTVVMHDGAPAVMVVVHHDGPRLLDEVLLRRVQTRIHHQWSRLGAAEGQADGCGGCGAAKQGSQHGAAIDRRHLLSPEKHGPGDLDVAPADMK
jgi:hypothetical protein